MNRPKIEPIKKIEQPQPPEDQRQEEGIFHLEELGPEVSLAIIDRALAIAEMMPASAKSTTRDAMLECAAEMVIRLSTTQYRMPTEQDEPQQ